MPPLPPPIRVRTHLRLEVAHDLTVMLLELHEQLPEVDGVLVHGPLPRRAGAAARSVTAPRVRLPRCNCGAPRPPMASSS